MGQFFGVNDDWNKPENDFTFVTREEAEGLLEGLEVIEMEEDERWGKIVSGEAKYWHAFHVLARKGED